MEAKHAGQRGGGAARDRGLTGGQLLQRARRRARLTQQELAERAGYSADYISKLERDQRLLPPSVIRRLVEVLGLSDADADELNAARNGRDGAGPPAERSLLAGRSDELAAVGRCLTDGAPPVLLLNGEPGIGKTRLLEEAMASAGESGWRVVQGSCQRHAQEPYAPFTDALTRSLEQLSLADRTMAVRDAGWLALLLPELAVPRKELDGHHNGSTAQASLAPEQERRLLFAAVSQYLRSVAGEAGTLLVLDDLQWAGADALDLLAALISSPHTPPVRVIGAYRDTDAVGGALQDLVAELVRASLVEVIPLGPLSDVDAQRLLAELVPAGDDGRWEALPAIARRAGGVPFFLLSYAEALRLQNSGDAPVELPWKVNVVIRNRVTALPEAVQAILRIAAVIGRVVPLPLLCRVAGLTEEEALTGLEIAAAARLLDEGEGAAYHFHHDLIRETIEGNLSPGRRRLLHRRIGEALERNPRTPAETLAFHFGCSDDHERAISYLERAGDQAAQQLAHASAAEFYRQAAERMERHDLADGTATLQEKLGIALYRGGHYDEAITAFERALRAVRAAGEDEAVDRVTGKLADAHFRRGPEDARLDHMARLVDEGGLDPEAGNAGSSGGLALREGLVRLLFARGSFKQMLTIGRSLARVGRITRNGRLQTMGERVEGVALIFLGRLAEGAGLIEATIPTVLIIEDDPRLVDVASVLAGAHLAMGSLDRSQAVSARMVDAAETIGDGILLAVHTLTMGTAMYVGGDWPSGRQYLRRAQELFEQSPPSTLTVRPVALLAPCLLMEGRWEEAWQYLETSRRWALSLRVPDGERAAVAHLAELDLLEGRPAEAVARVEPLLADPLGWGYAVVLLSTLAGAYLELEDLEKADAAAERAVAEARRMESWVHGVGALRVSALIQGRRGNEKKARKTLEEGLQRAGSMPYPHAEARLLEAGALLDRQRGDDAAAAARLAVALAIFERLGARKDVERLRRTAIR